MDAQGPAQGAAAAAWRQRAAEAINLGTDAQNQAFDRWQAAQAEADVARQDMEAAKAIRDAAVETQKERTKKWQKDGMPDEGAAEVNEGAEEVNRQQTEFDEKQEEFEDKQTEANDRAAEAKAASDALQGARDRLEAMTDDDSEGSGPSGNQVQETSLLPEPLDESDIGGWEDMPPLMWPQPEPIPEWPSEPIGNPFEGCFRLVPCPPAAKKNQCRNKWAAEFPGTANDRRQW